MALEDPRRIQKEVGATDLTYENGDLDFLISGWSI